MEMSLLIFVSQKQNKKKHQIQNKAINGTRQAFGKSKA